MKLKEVNKRYGASWLTLMERDKEPKRFLERFMASDFRNPVVGFKIFNSHDTAVQKHVLESEDYAKIILFRFNQFYRYTSEIIAQKTGVYTERKIIYL